MVERKLSKNYKRINQNMIHDIKTKKESLILKDFTSGLLYRKSDLLANILYGTTSQKIPVDIDGTYLELYSEYSDDYKKLFAYFHQTLNVLFDFMNTKAKGNKHFNAYESRELICLTEYIYKLASYLKNEDIIIKLNDSYADTLRQCTNFLSDSGGSAIPDDFQKINVIKYDPIFSITSDSAVNIKQQANSIKQAFDSDYLERQIAQMLEALEKHPADAIGKAKELVESCLKTILGDFGVNDLDKLEISELLKKVKEKLELKSEHQSITQVIGGLSGVTVGLAQLRNAKGTGHGKDAIRFKEPSVIEARLSVDTAIALTHFYWGLHQKKNKV
ncbi:MAG: abortive infection family protein [Elusimicrobiota bacterium]|nr:abortive infection family protein [Elusimicrobiota bacterium]